MEKILKGKVAIVLGDNIPADTITEFPKYRSSHGVGESIKEVTMLLYDPEFHKNVRKGDFVVGGKGFGWGKCHQAGPAFKYLGIGAVIAERPGTQPGISSAMQEVGIPVITCKEVTKKVSKGDELEINLAKGEIKNLTKGTSLSAEPFSDIYMQILEAGGEEAFREQRIRKTLKKQ